MVLSVAVAVAADTVVLECVIVVVVEDVFLFDDTVGSFVAVGCDVGVECGRCR